jgi:hypothetical protein
MMCLNIRCTFYTAIQSPTPLIYCSYTITFPVCVKLNRNDLRVFGHFLFNKFQPLWIQMVFSLDPLTISLVGREQKLG